MRTTFLIVLIGKTLLLFLLNSHICIYSALLDLVTRLCCIYNFQTCFNWIWALPITFLISPSLFFLLISQNSTLTHQVRSVANHLNSYPDVSLFLTWAVLNQSSILIFNISLELSNVLNWTKQYTWLSCVFVTFLHTWNISVWSTTLTFPLLPFPIFPTLSDHLKTVPLQYFLPGRYRVALSINGSTLWYLISVQSLLRQPLENTQVNFLLKGVAWSIPQLCSP